jgi:hypothetical protein
MESVLVVAPAAWVTRSKRSLYGVLKCWAENDLDLKQLMRMYKTSRETRIFRRMDTSSYNGEVVVGHPSFQNGSKAAMVDSKIILDVHQTIEYTPEDDNLARRLKLCCADALRADGTCRNMQDGSSRPRLGSCPGF